MSDRSPPMKLFHDMFARGLGELPMMRHKDDRVMLGNLVMDKGELVFKDRGVLAGVTPTRVAPCWDIGIVGAVCDLRGNEWDSLTLLGPDHCHIPVNLSSTRHGLLRSIVNATGENLIVYRGSVYRGFKLMLDAHLLPVVLPLSLETHEGVPGLAVCDFRFAAAPFDMTLKVNDLVRTAVERHLSLTVEDFEVSDDEFAQLFPGHVRKDA